MRFVIKPKQEGNHLIIRHTFPLNRVLKLVSDLSIVKVVQLLSSCLGILSTLDSQGNAIMNLVKSCVPSTVTVNKKADFYNSIM